MTCFVHTAAPDMGAFWSSAWCCMLANQRMRVKRFLGGSQFSIWMVAANGNSLRVAPSGTLAERKAVQTSLRGYDGETA